jgi:hypothetical protein
MHALPIYKPRNRTAKSRVGGQGNALLATTAIGLRPMAACGSRVTHIATSPTHPCFLTSPSSLGYDSIRVDHPRRGTACKLRSHTTPPAVELGRFVTTIFTPWVLRKVLLQFHFCAGARSPGRTSPPSPRAYAPNRPFRPLSGFDGRSPAIQERSVCASCTRCDQRRLDAGVSVGLCDVEQYNRGSGEIG